MQKDESVITKTINKVKAMPSLEEHCKHTLKRFKVEGRDIHKWLDEPSRVYGGIHREFRHDEETIIIIGKLFGDLYGVDIAQAIALDHIIADHEEAIKKRNERTTEQLVEIKNYKVEKTKYKKKKQELTRLIKGTINLPEIKTSSMRDYLETVCSDQSSALRNLAEISLRHWQKYLLSRDNPNSEIGIKDLTRFISNLRNNQATPITVANYLGQLVGYFNHESRQDLADFATDRKKMLQKQGKKKIVPIRVKDLMSLYRMSDTEDKVLMRLLLFGDIPIGSLGKIVVSKENSGKLNFRVGSEFYRVDETTIKIAEPLMSNNNSNLLSFTSDRQVAAHIHDLAQKLNVDYTIQAKTLRMFGKHINSEDLNEWLLTS